MSVILTILIVKQSYSVDPCGLELSRESNEKLFEIAGVQESKCGVKLITSLLIFNKTEPIIQIYQTYQCYCRIHSILVRLCITMGLEGFALIKG